MDKREPINDKIIPVAILFLASGCNDATTSAPPSSITEVTIATLKSQPVSVISDLTERTAAALNVEVRPQVSGIIQKRLFNEGDNVKAGQSLYQIAPASFRATWSEAAQKAPFYAALVKDNGVSCQDAEDARAG